MATTRHLGPTKEKNPVPGPGHVPRVPMVKTALGLRSSELELEATRGY